MKNRIVALILLAILSVVLVACADPFASDLPLEEKEDIVSTDKNSPEDTMTITGRMVIGKHSYLIVDEDLSPITMSVDGSADVFFDGINTGDKIEVVSGLVAESYPGQTHVYNVKVLEKGTEDDIPFSVLSHLRELGWID